MSIKLKLIIGFAIVSILAALNGLWGLVELRQVLNTFDREIPRGISHLKHHAEMDGLAKDIRFYDEVLSQSVRNYAYTENQEWKQRYLTYSPQLSAAIKQAIEQGKVDKQSIFEQLEKTNQALVAAETDALTLIDQGKASAAIRLIEGERYQSLKRLYSDQLEAYHSDRQMKHSQAFIASIDESARATQTFRTQLHVIMKEVTIIGIIIFVMSLIIGLLITQSIVKPIHRLLLRIQTVDDSAIKRSAQRKSESETIRLLHAFNRMTDNLVSANKQLSQSKAELEERVALRTEQLQQANAAKSQFLAYMSHEIRTPLNAIINLSSHLTRVNLPIEHQKTVNTINESSRHLLSIVNEVLDLSKIESKKLTLHPVYFDLHLAMQSVVDTLKTDADNKAIALNFVYPDTAPHWVYADKVRVRQIIINLVNNGIKFTKHGSVTLTVSYQAPEPSSHPETGTFTFTVQDTGPGINNEDQKRLFENFKQLHNPVTQQHQGSGLGLAICKELVTLMKGNIEIESHVGFGSKFRFSLSLPLPPPDYQASNHNEQTVISDHLRGRKIILAEDNPTNIAVAQLFFSEQQLTITTVENGQALLDQLNREQFDIILVDLEMPIMDGLTATHHIRTGKAGLTHQQAPIVALSAHSTSDHERRCQEAGVDIYLPKPIDFPLLFKTLENLSTQTSSHSASTPSKIKDDDKYARRMKKYRALFLAEIPLIVSAFEQYISKDQMSTEQFTQIQKTAHKHKSSSGQLGFSEVFEYLQHIEQQAKEENIQAVKQTYCLLKTALRRVEDELVAEAASP